MTSPTIRLRRFAAVATALAAAAIMLINAFGRERGWTADPNLGRSLERMTAKIVERQPVGTETLHDVYRHSLWSPFSPEPFLARAIEVDGEGRDRLALRALDEAIIRDPRSAGARLLRAEYFRRNGDIAGATREVAALVRVAPQNSTTLAAPLAELATNPRSQRIVRDLMIDMPALRPALFAYLAQSSSSSELMVNLALQMPAERPSPDWIDPVTHSLLDRGDLTRARAVWSSLTGIEAAGQLIINGPFLANQGTPPFNWRLASGPDGVAEYATKGGLEISYFGRNNLKLAEQTLTLGPGRYLLTANIEGSPGLANWSVQCVGSNQPFASYQLQAKPTDQWMLTVPQNCPVQVLTLNAIADDVSGTRSFVVRSVRLDRR